MFSEWWDEPIGVASIGQVHKARLRENGELVAVKLQFDRMEIRFRSDLNTLKVFCAMTMPQHTSAFAEVEKSFDSEFDYRLEASNLDEVRKGVLPRWGKLVHIPKPYLNYTSKTVLVMEYLEGKRLMDGLKDHFAAVAHVAGMTVEELEAKHEDMLRNKTFQYRTIEDERAFAKKIAVAGAVKGVVNVLNPLRLLRAISRKQDTNGNGKLGKKGGKWGDSFLDIARVLETICFVQATELLFTGAYNSDCHPGNILLLPDGKLGMLDFGQVKRMELHDRVKYARMILALEKDDRKEIVRIHFDEIGIKTKYRNETTGYLAACYYHDRDSEDITGNLDLVGFSEMLETVDPMIQLPEPFLLAMRGNLILRGVGKVMGVRLRMSQMWGNEARAFLTSLGLK